MEFGSERSGSTVQPSGDIEDLTKRQPLPAQPICPAPAVGGHMKAVRFNWFLWAACESHLSTGLQIRRERRRKRNNEAGPANQDKQPCVREVKVDLKVIAGM